MRATERAPYCGIHIGISRHGLRIRLRLKQLTEACRSADLNYRMARVRRFKLTKRDTASRLGLERWYPRPT